MFKTSFSVQINHLIKLCVRVEEKNKVTGYPLKIIGVILLNMKDFRYINMLLWNPIIEYVIAFFYFLTFK